MNLFDFKKLLENARLQAALKSKKQESKHAVMTFGRFQGITGGGEEGGPHGGHEGIIDHVKSVAAQHGADHFIFTSMSGPDHKVKAMRQKNPLHHKEKVGLMRKMFPNTNIHPHQSPYSALEHLGGQGYRSVTFVTGPDPGNESANEFRKGIAAHGKKLNIKVNFSGPSERVKGRGGVELKGSLQRQLAKSGNYKEFAKTLPSGANEEHGRTLFNALRRPIQEPKKVKKKVAKKRKITESSHSKHFEIDAISHLKPHSLIKKSKKSHVIRGHKKHRKIKIKKLAESIINFLNEERPRTAKEKTREYYSREYKKHQSSRKAIRERGQRWTARRRAAVRAAKRKLGSKSSGRTRDQLIKIGQKLLKGKDVDHKKALSKGGSNSNGNTRVVSTSYNRSRNNN
jgi:hypothetical protein